MTRARIPGWGLALLLALAALAVYANTLLNGFAMDDGAIIANNPRVHSLASFAETWSTPYWPEIGQRLGVYRPLIISLFALEWAVGGGAPWVFHAANMLLHAGVTVLVFFLLRRLVPVMPAAVGALLFAVHPVHTEAVANVVGQAEIVVAGALVAACLVHASRPAGVGVSWGRRIALVALYLLALFTKESAILLPGLLLVLDAAQRRIEWSRRGLARYADAMLLPLFLLLAAFCWYSVIRLGVLEGAFLGEDTGPQLAFLKQHRVLNAFRAFPEFMRLLFFPAQLSADYSPAVILPVASLTPMAALGLLLLAGLALLALLTPINPALGVPAAWFLVSISVVSNLLFPVGILVAERTLYLPSVAVAAAAAYAWVALTRRVPHERRLLLPAALALVVLAAGARTWTRNPVWASNSSLFTVLVQERPESYRAQWVQAAQMQSSGNRLMAALHFEAAYRIYPHNSELLTEYAAFLLLRKQYGRAIELLETAHGMHPRVMRTASMLGYAYLAAGRPADAIPLIWRVVELGGPRSSTMPQLAYAFENLGWHERSVAAWRVALRQPGGSTSVNWSFLARTLARAGYQADALQAATRAASLAPDSAAARQAARLADAIRTGCYSSLPAGRAPASAVPAPPPATAPAPPPPCDPLGDWLHGKPAADTGAGAATAPGNGG